MASTGTLIFETVVSDFIKVIPDIPVVETWEWQSDIISSWDGTEQRISIRDQPRRTVEYSILLADDVERNREYRRWFQFLSGTVIVPYYQYHTKITQNSVVGATKIFFSRDKTDFRDNDFAVVFRPSTEKAFLVALTTIDVDGGNTVSLSNAINIGDIVAPAFSSQMANNTGPKMGTVAGRISFNLQAILDRGTSFDRPSSTAVINTFDGLNVLDKRPLARQDADELFNIRPTEFDNLSGRIGRRTSLLHAIIAGGRQFTIARKTNSTEMDYWRDFITAARGMREPFLFPTWREDLFLDTNPNPGDPQILIQGTDYETLYFPHDTFKRIQIQNPTGSIEFRKITVTTPQPGLTTLLTLDTPVTNDSSWGNGFTIGFLNRVRFVTDTIRLNHFASYSIITVSMGTTDQ